MPAEARFTGVVPSALRSRLALAVLLGIFLIPIGTSSLRGITHVLTCEEPTEVGFTLVVPEQGEPTILGTAPTLERGQEPGLCGGLLLNAGARREPTGKLAVRLSLTNQTAHPWQGTVNLKLGGTSLPVDIGEVAAGETETDEVSLKVGPGSHQLASSLLIGP